LCEEKHTEIPEQVEDEAPQKRGAKSIACAVAIFIIKFYRFAISPHLAGCCRFEPTCSTYGLQAFQKYGFSKAFVLTAKRLMRCRPGGPHGYDPVP
jgi:hypothetical protein